MKEIWLDSYGKVNLSLDIVNKRQDGYHNIESIMQEIDLKDRILLRDRRSGFSLDSNASNIPLDEDNLVYKAYQEMKKESGLDRGLEVYIDKKIPVGGGLAGGSSNAAATLKGLNQLWGLGYSLEKLQKIGVRIGADLPFCLQGGTAYASGIGDRLVPLKSFKDQPVLLANSGQFISTARVYESLGLDQKVRPTRIKDQIEDLEKGNLDQFFRKLYNIMEEPVFRDYREIGAIKETMLDSGGLVSLMSGTGATVFALFDDRKKMEDCSQKLKKYLPFVYMGRTR